MPTTTPLTDAIQALTTYANETTGASDTTLSQAVATLVAGYGGGGVYIDDIITHNYANGAEVATNVTMLYSSTFEDTGIVSFTAPNITQLKDYRYSIFKNCRSLTSVSFSSLTTITNYVVDSFRGCTSLTSVTMPNLTTISNRCSGLWYGCTALTSISLPKLTTVASYSDEIWKGCTALSNVNLPVLTELGTSEFENCTSLVNVVLPSCKSMYSTSFKGCTSLQKFDMLGSTSGNGIRQTNFQNCSSLDTLIIRVGSGACVLGNINNFTGTPFASGGTGGTLYVPQALISSYQSASNWSTILGYANNQILPIEGSQYENYYADGTPI